MGTIEYESDLLDNSHMKYYQEITCPNCTNTNLIKLGSSDCAV